MKYYLSDLPIIEIRQCVRCGESFGITSRQKSKKYCDPCKAIYHQEYYKREEVREKSKIKAIAYYHEHTKNKKSPKRQEITCVRCGKKFLLGKGKTDICIECLLNSEDKYERRRGELRRDYSIE